LISYYFLSQKEEQEEEIHSLVHDQLKSVYIFILITFFFTMQVPIQHLSLASSSSLEKDLKLIMFLKAYYYFSNIFLVRRDL